MALKSVLQVHPDERPFGKRSADTAGVDLLVAIRDVMQEAVDHGNPEMVRVAREYVLGRAVVIVDLVAAPPPKRYGGSPEDMRGPLNQIFTVQLSPDVHPRVGVSDQQAVSALFEALKETFAEEFDASGALTMTGRIALEYATRRSFVIMTIYTETPFQIIEARGVN